MEKDKILDLRSIDDYNKFLGLETKNPLVGIIDFSKVKVLRHRRKCGTFYAIFLKEKIHGQLVYGRGKYDYQEDGSNRHTNFAFMMLLLLTRGIVILFYITVPRIGTRIIRRCERFPAV